MKKVLVSLWFLVLCSVSFAGPKEDIIGYYKFDIESIKKTMEERIASLPEEWKSQAKEDMAAVLKSSRSAVMQFTEKEMNGWAIGELNIKETYTIEKVEGNTLEIKLSGSVSNVVVKKGSVEFTSGHGQGMKLLKITEKEAKEMIAKVEAENKKKETPPVEEKTPAEGGGME